MLYDGYRVSYKFIIFSGNFVVPEWSSIILNIRQPCQRSDVLEPEVGVSIASPASVLCRKSQKNGWCFFASHENEKRGICLHWCIFISEFPFYVKMYCMSTTSSLNYMQKKHIRWMHRRKRWSGWYAHEQCLLGICYVVLLQNILNNKSSWHSSEPSPYLCMNIGKMVGPRTTMYSRLVRTAAISYYNLHNKFKM